MERHYLVTGGCGFIGSHIVEALVGRGERVTVFDNLSTGKRENLATVAGAVRLVVGDVRRTGELDAAMAGITHVFHEAANVSMPLSVEQPEMDHAVNCTGTLNVLCAARRHGVRRVVSASSCAVYGNDPELPKTETMLPAPASPYAAGKLANEHHLRLFARLYGLQTVALRYFNVFGPRQDPSSVYSGVISIFARCALENQPPSIYGDGEQTRDFVFVGDVVRANLLAMEAETAGQGEVINIGTGSRVSLLELLAALRQITGAELAPVFREARAGDVKHSVADISLAGRLLGYAPRHPLQEGLRELLGR